jgi:hypothetical protein
MARIPVTVQGSSPGACGELTMPFSLRGCITRFGAYATGELGCHPEAFNPVLKEVDFTVVSLTA